MCTDLQANIEAYTVGPKKPLLSALLLRYLRVRYAEQVAPRGRRRSITTLPAGQNQPIDRRRPVVLLLLRSKS